jgi:PIN domain nuclease of toxin-antitoxin system
VTAPLLLDTCALIWSTSIGGAPKLRAQLLAAYDSALPVWISPISAWEIGTLAALGRIGMTRPVLPWFDEAMARAGARLADLGTRVLVASTDLPGQIHRDPADRIIIATAREFGLRIVTRDRKILDYAAQGHVMALEC